MNGAIALWLAFGLAAVTTLVLWLSARLRRERERASALRGALEASLCAERVLHSDKLRATVQELRRRTHEANNALSTALLSAQYLLDASRAEPFSAEVRADLVAAAAGMVEALQKLRVQTDRGPKSSPGNEAHAALAERVELARALGDCVARARRRHRGVSIEALDPGPGLEGAAVAVCSGCGGLAAALDALLDNAARAARARVQVGATAQREVGVVAIEVRDDGAGFAREQLERPIAAFDGAPDALGLGLYTAERIARASLGSLRRANGEVGGAVVSLFLPLAQNSAQ